MNTRLEEIKNYFISREISPLKGEDFDLYVTNTVNLATLIAIYAHRNQYREDGLLYISHLQAMEKLYKDYLFIDNPMGYEFDLDEIYKLGIPYDGVLEVIWLHDVIEDTDFNLKEIKDMFMEIGCCKSDYFDSYIGTPLELITHDKKNDEYDTYISKCCKNQTSALVKLIDMAVNTNLFTLKEIDRNKIYRSYNYMKYMKHIDEAYSFLTKRMRYAQIIKALKEGYPRDDMHTIVTGYTYYFYTKEEKAILPPLPSDADLSCLKYYKLLPTYHWYFTKPWD